MYLSTLLIDAGTNPDRPRPGRPWLRNLYRVHQRLCMAFPSKQKENDDREFLQPFTPEKFAQGHVHVRRGRDAGFLFRVDSQVGGRAVIVVLSALDPKWDYAFQNARHLLAAPPHSKPYAPSVAVGQQWRFRTICNAVFRARPGSTHANGQPIKQEWVGKRIGIPGDEKSLEQWIHRRSDAAGFAIRGLTLMQPGYVYVNKSNDKVAGQRLRSVRYEGILEINDSERFLAAMCSGLGPGKAFGFGLLSIAPIQRGFGDAL